MAFHRLWRMRQAGFGAMNSTRWCPIDPRSVVLQGVAVAAGSRESVLAKKHLSDVRKRKADFEKGEGYRTMTSRMSVFRPIAVFSVAAMASLFTLPVHGAAPNTADPSSAKTDASQTGRALQKDCDGGDMQGCFHLGFCFEMGRCGLERDVEKAGVIYGRACRGRNASACNNLGVYYRRGDRGLSLDLHEAAELFRTACDDGNLTACKNLALCYERGDCGFSKDAGQAARLVERANGGNHGPAGKAGGGPRASKRDAPIKVTKLARVDDFIVIEVAIAPIGDELTIRSEADSHTAKRAPPEEVDYRESNFVLAGKEEGESVAADAFLAEVEFFGAKMTVKVPLRDHWLFVADASSSCKISVPGGIEMEGSSDSPLSKHRGVRCAGDGKVLLPLSFPIPRGAGKHLTTLRALGSTLKVNVPK
jgi:hypothetical protein